MTFIFLPVVLLAVLASIFLMTYAFIKNNSDKSFYLIFLSAATFLYIFGYLLEIRSHTLDAAFYAVRIQYIGWPMIMPMTYLFIRDVYGEKRLSPIRIAALLTVPGLVMGAVQFFPFVRLYYIKIAYVFNGFIANCRIFPGPLYYVWVLYGYLLVVFTIKFLVRRMKQSSGRERRQGWFLLFSILVPVVASLAYLFLYKWIRFDPTPLSASISLALMLYAVGYDNLLNMLSFARIQVIEEMRNALVICDNHYNFLDANRAAKALFPELQKLTPGMSMSQIPSFKTDGELWLNVQGERRFFDINQTPIQDGSKHSGFCVVFHDMTEREHLLKKLEKQANFDPLLHIYNRATFFNIVNQTLGAEKNQNTAYALLMIDIDHFKRVNDEYGHPCGDIVLETIALAVKGCLRKEDLVGRYGGEELIVLLVNPTSEQAVATAHRLRATIEKTPCNCDNETILHSTVSVGGVYISAGERPDLERLVAQADTRLYQAKRSGRNHVCF